MSNQGFDAQGFYDALDTERMARKKTWKQVATEAKVSASTLTRMGQGKRPDVDSLAALASWSGLKVDEFIGGRKLRQKKIESLTELTGLLRTDRNLSPEGAKTLEVILKSAYEHLRQMRREDEEGF